MKERGYILDANIFIEAARRYYSFDFGTKFWDFLVEKAQFGILCSIDKVFEEINKGDKGDPLKIWAEKSFSPFFKSTESDPVIQIWIEIVNLVASQNDSYSPNAIDQFLEKDNADAWVIAFAKHENMIVVTHESFNPKSRKKVLIPNVCAKFGIEFIDTFEMLKNLKFKL